MCVCCVKERIQRRRMCNSNSRLFPTLCVCVFVCVRVCVCVCVRAVLTETETAEEDESVKTEQRRMRNSISFPT